nr:hypothetical protein [Herbidospora yilanensis]
MNQFPVWSIVGLVFGTILGIVGAFGGLNAFLIVLVLGVVGFFVGLALEGGIQVPKLRARRQ